MVPTQAYLERAREARATALALIYYSATHDGKLPPDPRHPPSIPEQVAADRRSIIVAKTVRDHRYFLGRRQNDEPELQKSAWEIAINMATQDSLLAKIGALMIASFERGSARGLLYVEAIPGVMSASVYEETNDRVLDRGVIGQMYDALNELWYLAEPDKRWSALVFDVVDHAFDAQFRYDEDKEYLLEKFEERREALLLARFGDKPVIYPPPPDDAL
jgi:hypothetical protein